MNSKRFKNILIGFAFSPNLKANVFEALRLSNNLKGSLFFLHVGKKTQIKSDKFNDILASSPIKSSGTKVIWREGNAVETIITQCEKNNIDLLLLGALQRENVLRFYLGSIARKITRKSPCSVLLLIKPSIDLVVKEHMVVNAFKSAQTTDTISAAFDYAKKLNIPKITLVDEINQSKIDVKVDDDVSLKKATKIREELTETEKKRVSEIIKSIPSILTKDKQIKSQSIFGKRGYSIGHYARITRADLLVINSEEKRDSFWNRFFPKDLEHILSELPTDVLIVKKRL
ncbi:MAG: universal stress protein UspA [Flavobacteriaceae bacterium]|nr:universal stress protein UspA [Flavobacteriaceae bacterium]